MTESQEANTELIQPDAARQPKEDHSGARNVLGVLGFVCSVMCSVAIGYYIVAPYINHSDRSVENAARDRMSTVAIDSAIEWLDQEGSEVTRVACINSTGYDDDGEAAGNWAVLAFTIQDQEGREIIMPVPSFEFEVGGVKYDIYDEICSIGDDEKRNAALEAILSGPDSIGSTPSTLDADVGGSIRDGAGRDEGTVNGGGEMPREPKAATY